MIRRLMNSASGALATFSLLAAAPALADDVKLPPTMTVTAYDTGTAGFTTSTSGLLAICVTGCRSRWMS